MAEPVWVGVDLGTQSVRAVAVDDGGALLGAAARPLTGHRDGDRHEQDPHLWWTQTADALAAMVAQLPAGAARGIGGVAVCGTSGTVLLTDADGTPRTAGLMYDDSRAAAMAARAQEAGAEVWDRLGYRIQPAWALPKLLWWCAQGLVDAGTRLAHQPDVVTAALVGAPVAADASHALKTGYDLLRGGWPQEVFDRLGVPATVLPPVVAAGSVLGRVSAAAARRTGLPAGTRVVAGMTDGSAAQLAAGALTPGAWNSVLGTTLALKGVTRTLLHDPTGALYSHRAPLSELWLPGGASSTGAGAVSTLFPGADLDALTERAAGVDAPPVCYPLVGHGERFPFVAPQARGFLRDHRLADHPLRDGVESMDPAVAFAAVCTGVAHLERLCFDLLDDAGADITGPVSFTGGGTRNAWWSRLRCDLLGVEVRIPANPEPAVGMAVLAAGSAERDLPAAAARIVHTATVLQPDRARGAALAPGYTAFVDALVERGWLDPRTAEHARKRAAA